jgi:hypothetical protein
MDDLHSKIRERAHEIWEREGRPDGRAEEHWSQAERELGITQTSAPGKKSGNGAGKPRAAKSVEKSVRKSPAKSQESGQRR